MLGHIIIFRESQSPHLRKELLEGEFLHLVLTVNLVSSTVCWILTLSVEIVVYLDTVNE